MVQRVLLLQAEPAKKGRLSGTLTHRSESSYKQDAPRLGALALWVVKGLARDRTRVGGNGLLRRRVERLAQHQLVRVACGAQPINCHAVS